VLIHNLQYSCKFPVRLLEKISTQFYIQRNSSKSTANFMQAHPLQISYEFAANFQQILVEIIFIKKLILCFGCKLPVKFLQIFRLYISCKFTANNLYKNCLQVPANFLHFSCKFTVQDFWKILFSSSCIFPANFLHFYRLQISWLSLTFFGFPYQSYEMTLGH